MRRIDALLAEQNERWLERKYFDMDEFQQWADAHPTAVPSNTVVTLKA